MLGPHPANIKNQPACVKPLDSLAAFSLANLVPFAGVDAPSRADSPEPSLRYFRMNILVAKREQGGKQPWR